MSGTIAGLASAALGTGNVGGIFARFLRPASLRGVPFWIVAAEDSTTRRWVTHEFPARDAPWHEDLGAGPAGFGVEGLLIGDDVGRQANRLRAAAAAAGPARLVHPWYGTLQVVVQACEVSLDANEGRVARFRLRLERHGQRPAPAISAGLAARILDWVDELAATVAEAVANLRELIALPDAAISTVLGIAGGIAGALSRGLTVAGLAGVLAGTATGRALLALGALLPEDATDPARVAARVDAALLAVALLPPGTAAVVNAPLAVLLDLAALDKLAPVPTDRTTPAAAAVADVASAIAAAARLQLGARAAQAALSASWETRDDALRDRDRLSDALDAGAEAAAALGWDGAWRAALALRAVVVAEVTERAAPLPRLRRLALPAPVPSSLLAYGLDGDATGDVFARGQAIAARNRARHPGFLPAGRTIEVLE